MTKPKILLADDHTLFVEALQKVLEPMFELVGSVGDGRALLDAAPRLHGFDEHRPNRLFTEVRFQFLPCLLNGS